MSRRTFRARRFRLRFAWMALLALLLQQVALIAYACPLTEARPVQAGMMADCIGMDMPGMDMSGMSNTDHVGHDAGSPLLCDQHCLRDHVASTDLQAPQVPALALPPVYFALADALLPPAQSRHYQDVPSCHADPPPAQRFCSLQI